MLERIEKHILDDRARLLFGFLSSLYSVTRDDETPVGEWARWNKEVAGCTGPRPFDASL